MILPALADVSKHPPYYSFFPPLGLATLAGYLRDDDAVTVVDEHVEVPVLDDDPDLVVIQVYVTSARRSYEIADHYRARGAHVCLGGLHVTALPDEASQHADTIFLGPGEDTWPAFLADYRAGRPGTRYVSTHRSLYGAPPVRRDLIRSELYLCPNSLVVSRGCPHHCDFCYKDAFYQGGKSFYTQAVDAVLAEIDQLPGRHLYFLDDHLFGDARFATALFDGMRGMGRVWQAAGTVPTVLAPDLLEKAVESGLRSLFLGFETFDQADLRSQRKVQNIGRDYAAAISRLHGMGVMVNGSFIFGLDSDDVSVFDRTLEWARTHGVETAVFHVLTPYPGTRLFDRMSAQGRLLHRDWDRYDTCHAVFRPARMSPEELEEGFWRAWHEYYRWPSILGAAGTKDTMAGRLRHLAYTGAWKRFKPIWKLILRTNSIRYVTPVLEAVLAATVRVPEPASRREAAAGPAGGHAAGRTDTVRSARPSP